MVGGIAAQVNSLGQRIDILGGVGQSAENCFSMYEERLQRTEGELLGFEGRCEKAFSNVRVLMDQKEAQNEQSHSGLNEKFEGLAIYLGEVEGKLSGKISLETQRLDFYNHEQTMLSQRTSRLEHMQNDAQESLEGLKKTTREELDILHEEGRQLSERVHQEILSLKETHRWVREEMTKALKVMGEAREEVKNMLEKEMAERKMVGLVRLGPPGQGVLWIGGDLPPQVPMLSHVHVVRDIGEDPPSFPICIDSEAHQMGEGASACDTMSLGDIGCPPACFVPVPLAPLSQGGSGGGDTSGASTHRCGADRRDSGSAAAHATVIPTDGDRVCPAAMPIYSVQEEKHPPRAGGGGGVDPSPGV